MYKIFGDFFFFQKSRRQNSKQLRLQHFATFCAKTLPVLASALIFVLVIDGRLSLAYSQQAQDVPGQTDQQAGKPAVGNQFFDDQNLTDDDPLIKILQENRQWVDVSNLVIAMEKRIAWMEKEVGRLTDLVERYERQIKRLDDRLSGVSENLSSRLTEIENTQSASPASFASKGNGQQDLQKEEQDQTAKTDQAQENGPARSAHDLYASSISALRQRNFDAAEKSFLVLLDLHQDHPLTANAQFWLGEIYYVQGFYVEAADAYISSLETNTSGEKSAESMLKLGLSLSALGLEEQACETFSSFSSLFGETDGFFAKTNTKRARSPLLPLIFAFLLANHL